MGKEERSQRGHSKRRVSDRGKVTIGDQEKNAFTSGRSGSFRKKEKGWARPAEASNNRHAEAGW